MEERILSLSLILVFFFSSRSRHTRLSGDWSSDVCSADLAEGVRAVYPAAIGGMLVAEEAQDLPHAAPAAARSMGAAVEVPADASAELLARAAAAAALGTDAYAEFWAGATKDDRKALADRHRGLKDEAAAADAARTIDADG